MAAPSTLVSTRIRALMAALEAPAAQSESLSSVNGSQSASLSSEKDSHADRETEVQALQDKLAALLAAARDAHAAHSKSLSQKDAEISTLRARVVELEGRVDELVKEKEHIGTTEDLNVAEDGLREAGIEIGRTGHSPGSADKDLEKAPYVAKAKKLKAEYTKKMDAYNNPQAGGPEASGDSDKSKSEINDEEGGSENDE